MVSNFASYVMEQQVWWVFSLDAPAPAGQTAALCPFFPPKFYPCFPACTTSASLFKPCPAFLPVILPYFPRQLHDASLFMSCLSGLPVRVFTEFSARLHWRQPIYVRFIRLLRLHLFRSGANTNFF
jgi:hypothetical protein